MEDDADPEYIGRNLTGLQWVIERDHRGQIYLAEKFCNGEIAISGQCLARSYLGLRKRTKESFIDAPDFVKELGSSRLYLTGDVGRYEQDEKIRFLGRNDNQVKINGVRIELGESEHQLRLMGGAFSTTVVECVRLADTRKLAAYMVMSSEEHDPNADDLLMTNVPDGFKEDCLNAQRQLYKLMPCPLVPTIYVPVSYIPKTTSGKIDRKHLGTVFEDSAGQADGSVVIGAGTRGEGRDPQSKEELAMEEAWQEVLDQDTQFNVADNFFHVGGDPLTAIKLVLATRQRGFELVVGAVHEKLLLGDMAATMVPTASEDSTENNGEQSSGQSHD
ncbi:MAG: putative secondary metabolism biosynthetic enzyme [Peltula sp. TS41687]|nr:MAG: putative secondary metabolism biosynthetic enzyme [Peltula sp. TS41687]